MNWFSFYHDVQQYLKYYSDEVLDQVLLGFTEYLYESDLSEEEDKLVELSRQAFLEYKRRQPLTIEGEEILSESDSDEEQAVNNDITLLSETVKEQVRTTRRAIKQRAKRLAAKEIASKSILK